MTANKKVFRQTNAQIVADTAEKNAVKTASAEVAASKEAAKKKEEIPMELPRRNTLCRSLDQIGP